MEKNQCYAVVKPLPHKSWTMSLHSAHGARMVKIGKHYCIHSPVMDGFTNKVHISRSQINASLPSESRNGICGSDMVTHEEESDQQHADAVARSFNIFDPENRAEYTADGTQASTSEAAPPFSVASPQAHHPSHKWNLDLLSWQKDSQKVRVSHRDLIDGELHEKSNSVSALEVKSPALPTSGDEPLHFSDHKRFRIAVGKPAIRADIQYAVKELSRILSAPPSKDQQLSTSSDISGAQNLVFRIAPSTWRLSQCIELRAYCESYWAGCPVSRKSTTGVTCQLWSASIVHYSRTQATVAQSSVEAEFSALTSAANDFNHLQSVIIEVS
eukprot:2333933-Amphidinium_carterae.4